TSRTARAVPPQSKTATVVDLHAFKRGQHGARSARAGANAAGVVGDHGIADVGLARTDDVDAVLREAEDVAVLNVDCPAGKKPDAVESEADAVDPQISEGHDIARPRLNHDTVREGHQDRRDWAAATGDGDRLGDVTAPKPPGSSASISPPAAVFEMAPAKVLHGAVRLHGLASSPTPETQVRLACAFAAEVPTANPATATNPRISEVVGILILRWSEIFGGTCSL